MGHWYDKNGNSVYTVIGKNGKERGTTIRDARQLNLAPSVMGIISQRHREGIEFWKRDQILNCAWECREKDYFELVEYKKDILRFFQINMEKAPKLGTEIHNSLEEYFKGNKNVKHYEICEGVKRDLLNFFKTDKLPDLVVEKSFYCDLGFGGKVDIIFPSLKENEFYIMDFKTKNSNRLEKSFDYAMQLAAYSFGLNGNLKAICANVFISLVNPALSLIAVYSQEELEIAWKCFKCLLRLWQLENDFNTEIIYEVN